MKRLHVLRHTKSDWGEPGLEDHDRPLSPRGRRAAVLIAAHCRQARVRPALVLCSTATRARETLAAVMPGLGLHARASFRPSLYGASVEAIERMIRGLDPALGSAMIVGHNPELQDLVLDLAGTGEAIDRVRAKFPTGALATLEFDGQDWRDVRRGRGRLAGVVVPRDLEHRAQKP